MMSSMANSVVILDNVPLVLSEDDIAKIAEGLGQVDGLVLETDQETTATTVNTATLVATTPAAAATSAADNEDSWFRTVPFSRPGATPGRLSSGRKIMKASAAATTPAAAATPAADTPAVTPAAAANDDDWFRAGPSAGPSSRATPGRLSSGKKNMKVLLKSLRSPSPIPSTISTQSSVADEEEEDSDECLKFFEEEQRRRNEEEARRTEWRRRAAEHKGVAEKKWIRARELKSSLAGEGKRINNQREALRAQQRAIDAQLRALDDEEADLEKRKRSAFKSERKYGSIVAKYREMDL